MYLGRDLDLSGSRDVIDHVTIRLPLYDFQQVLHWHRPVILNCFGAITPIMHPNRDLDLSGWRDVISQVTIRFAIYISYRCSVGTDTLCPTDFQILKFKCIEVMTFTIQGHVTSSITWPFDSHYMTSYRSSIDTDPLCWTVFKILSLYCMWIATLTFQGHVTSSVTWLFTWPFNSTYMISYRCSVDTFFLSTTVIKIFWSTSPILSQACTFPLKLAWHKFWVVEEGKRGIYHFSTFKV